jgi:MerR family mercuric resistance operon transcriptional regulator
LGHRTYCFLSSRFSFSDKLQPVATTGARDNPKKEITVLRAENFSIGELSKRTGVHIETIRYYERIKMTPKPPRTEGGRRIYDDAFVQRLGFISRSRQLGFSLKEIRQLLELVDGKNFSCADIRELTLRQATEIERKIKDLQKLKKRLNNMAAKCHGDAIPDCAIIDSLFARI